MTDPVKKPLDFVFQWFLSDKTNLLYDYRTDLTQPAWHGLPDPEQISRQVPNPCGYGTGMEDSVLNGGSLLDGLVGKFAVTQDASIKPIADRIFQGLVRCGQIPGNPGFIARSISPADGRSCYIDSSRDQYTHWVYAAIRFYRSPLCEEPQKLLIRQILAEIAEKCQRDVTVEHDFRLLRADGRPGLVSKMWGDIHPHECLRLPMIYLAAFYATGDARWNQLYHQYRDEALNRTFSFYLQRQRCYVLLQMQYSLRLIYELDPDPTIRPRMLSFMEELARFGESRAMANRAELCMPARAKDLCYPFHPWDQVTPIDMGEFEGFRYLNPAQSERKENTAFYPLREIGEAASVAALCPERRISESLIAAIQDMINAMDYDHHYSVYGPLLLACGHMLCRENLYRWG